MNENDIVTGRLYIIEQEGSFAVGSIIIFALNKIKLQDVIQPVKDEWPEFNFDDHIIFEEEVQMKAKFLNTILSNTVDMA